MKRMAPGCTNTVEYEIYGMNSPPGLRPTTQRGVLYKKRRARTGLEPTRGWKQARVPRDYGRIFEFGFSDSLLQMFAAFVSELRQLPCPFGCFRPDEAALSHKVLTAALRSKKERRSVAVSEIQ
jgi:predicted dehydrogenase